MRGAVRLVEEVLREGVALVKPGVTEIELVAELEYRMKKLGAQGPSFDTLVLAGAKSATTHAPRTARPCAKASFCSSIWACSRTGTHPTSRERLP